MSYKSLLVAAAIVLSPALAFADGAATPAASSAVKADKTVTQAKTDAAAPGKTDKTAGSTTGTASASDKGGKSGVVKAAASGKTHKVAHHKPKAVVTPDKTDSKPASTL